MYKNEVMADATAINKKNKQYLSISASFDVTSLSKGRILPKAME